MPQNPTFRTAEGEARYLAAYDETLKLWPVQPEPVYLPTRFGSVHALLAGPAEAPPLVLLPATNASAAMWYPNVGALTRCRRIVALDTLGHTGRSVPSAKVASPADCAAWILDALDGLGIQQTDIMGLSLGGWLALNLALQAPNRVRRVVTGSPIGAFGPVSMRVLLRMLPMLFFPRRPAYERYMRWVLAKGKSLAPALFDQFVLGMQEFRYANPGMFMPRPFRDEELRSLAAPTLLLLGKEEVMFDRLRALARATQLMPDVEAKVISRAGHFLTAEQPGLVNTLVFRFLTGTSAFQFHPMTDSEAAAIAKWHYNDLYSFYDPKNDFEDLAELLDPQARAGTYFSAADANGELTGLLAVTCTGGVADVGLGLRPDLTGMGIGQTYFEDALNFIRSLHRPHTFRLCVAAFNQRAITVYERAGFHRTRTFLQATNGGEYEFVEMTRPA